MQFLKYLLQSYSFICKTNHRSPQINNHMIRKLLILTMITGFGLSQLLQAQCTPGNATTCPDPENNGQICPDTLPNANEGQAYSVTVTILPPPSATYNNVTVPLNKIVLLDILNMPPGLNWVSNSTTNTFFPGTYYCVLMSGTPTTPGFYQLKIKVGVYITFLGNPLYIGENIDSTSVSITVTPATSRPETITGASALLDISPNPFLSYATWKYRSEKRETLTLELLSITGNTILSSTHTVDKGDNVLRIDMPNLAPGMYIYRLRTERQVFSGRVIKAE